MATAGYNSQFAATSGAPVTFTNEATTDTGDHQTYVVTNSAHRLLDPLTAVVVQSSPDGTTWSTASGYTLNLVGGIVTFASPVTGRQVRLASGKYQPWILIGGANKVDFSASLDTEDVTEFNTTGTHSYLPTLMSGTVKASVWWLNTARVAALQNRDKLIVSFVLPTGRRLEGYCFTTDSNVQSDVKSAVKEELTFLLTDQFFSH
jgi:hypothetical protein